MPLRIDLEDLSDVIWIESKHTSFFTLYVYMYTCTPRDCLGKNFAQMEMRTILAMSFMILYKFNLELKHVLSEPYSDENVKKNGGLENFKY